MKKKSVFIISAALSMAVTLGCISMVCINQNQNQIFANKENKYGLLFDKTNNKLSTFNDPVRWVYNPITVKTDLLSKANKIRIKACTLKDNPDGWQTFGIHDTNGYFSNVDHIIGMDSIMLNFTGKDKVANLNVYYSSRPITLENKDNCNMKTLTCDANATVNFTFDFDKKLPNYFMVQADKADVYVNKCQININDACHDFYKTVDLSNSIDNASNLTGSGDYLEGSSVTISSTPKSNMEFVGWFDKQDKLVSEQNPYTFTMPTTNVSYVAKYQFVENQNQYMTFGSYPQSKVIDEALISSLNTAAGELPTATLANEWVSYNYYISNSNATDYMWYKDVTLNADKYRGVYFTSYRPFNTTGVSNADNSSQDHNGYLINNVYWFKYEPITWRILNETGLMVSEKILDSQEFYHNASLHDYNQQRVYANNYEASNIRNWLNNNFINTAFNEAESNKIQTTLVKNGPSDSLDIENKYACNDTNDKVFLLSKKEVMNPEYNFYPSEEAHQSRTSKCSDYAAAMGCQIHSENTNSSWWTRSSLSSSTYRVQIVNMQGKMHYMQPYSTNFAGVRPSIVIGK